ncbi:hypothetical protein GQ602_003339 [Ophiocordyceps camponoti-floridani]|uniref:Uncharacterized protein n=1 Tax=Ophiocordyceps camponoti-floridani TaxID=2030778 RepID=A0A8H4Q817_9HYPO|nr:hypothetical protein GQ602_003339 [Ophiocordyceps camponoti-floridani]
MSSSPSSSPCSPSSAANTLVTEHTRPVQYGRTVPSGIKVLVAASTQELGGLPMNNDKRVIVYILGEVQSLRDVVRAADDLAWERLEASKWL